MLFNCILLVVAVLVPIEVAYLVVWVSKQLKNPSEKVVLPTIKRNKTPKVSKEVQRTLDILGNIDAYDGTSFGQKEIK